MFKVAVGVQDSGFQAVKLNDLHASLALTPLKSAPFCETVAVSGLYGKRLK